MLRATQVNLLSHLQTQEELQTRGGDRVPNARTLKTASARSAKWGLIYIFGCVAKQGNVEYFRKNELKIIKIDFGADNFIQHKKFNTFNDHREMTNKIFAIFKE